MKVVGETKRLTIRHFNLNDAEFIVRLLNEESFIRYIADKNVRTRTDAINYLTNGPISSYQHYECGLSLVLLKGTETPIGMCGLLKREELDVPDLGFAFLPEFWGKGYANEAACSVLKEGLAVNSLNTILAVTLPDNVGSNSLLKKVGFSLQGKIEIYGSQSNLYEYRV
ncbi:GNAT family N-acetyltransferase [Colwellia sp. 12G3]|uniref:GNAT family N-acetyltransferase n=1 Tax=Colwellia sp. 12G3 TaxID=2058299 RepID=UPI000C33614C|nr:GNAT family N-acetyltransferase [Colwellia sp. 12G3]PKI15949.1 GNAT family N-acetyltransferase [Colwellia sp. 12G3]